MDISKQNNPFLVDGEYRLRTYEFWVWKIEETDEHLIVHPEKDKTPEFPFPMYLPWGHPLVAKARTLKGRGEYRWLVLELTIDNGNFLTTTMLPVDFQPLPYDEGDWGDDSDES